MKLFRVVIFCFIFNTLSIKSARILAVFPSLYYSHHQVYPHFITAFLNKGYEIVLITPWPEPYIEEGNIHKNLTLINLQDASLTLWKEGTERIIAQNQDDVLAMLKKTFELILEITEKQFQTDEVKSLTGDKNIKFDVLLVESFMKVTLMISHYYKVPVIEISTLAQVYGDFENIGAPIQPLLYPRTMRKRINNLTFCEELLELYNDYHIKKIFYETLGQNANEAIKNTPFGSTPSIDVLQNNVHMLYLNTHPVWDTVRPVPISVLYTFGIHKKPYKELPHDLLNYLEASVKGVVYVAFGTTANICQYSTKVQIFLNAFSKLPYDFLFKWSEDVLPGKPDNVKIAKWLPQADLLKHSKIKAFITQGGVQSTDEGIHAGVPLIGIPLIWDQWNNVERYVRHGIGIKLEMGEITEEQIIKAVNTVINDDSHVTRTANWLPPAESWPVSRDGSGSGSGSHADQEDEDLPYGWEQALDSRGKAYYINHVNKTTTYVAPEGCSCESPPAPRDVVLERDPELGFGFVAGSEKPVLVRFVTDNSPSVGKLEPGDQILCVNGEDVSLAAREYVISAVRACTEQVTLRVCQPARSGNPMRRSALLSAAKRARLRARPPRVRFADSVQLNGAPMYPPSAFSLGDLCLPPMANVLKVFLENGQTKSFKYDSTTTVADVVTSLKDKLCITAEEHFSLVVEHVKSLRRNKLTLLDPKEFLARIAARPGSHKMRCLFRIVFMPTSAAELAQRDLAALDYLYLQCCNDVAQERFAPELQPDIALRLAALHMHQHALANNVSPAKLTVKAVEREFGLERFVPSGLLESMKRKELRRLIAHFLKLNSQMTGSQRQLTQLQAKLHYLDIVAGLPSYGAKCFSSTRPERVLLVSPRFGLSQIVGRSNSVPQSIASLEEVEGIRVKPEGSGSSDVAIFLKRDRVLALLMDERDAAEMPLVIAGYYRLATGQELNVEQEREPITEDIAPPYLSQHNVVPTKWSYLNCDDPNVLSKKHYAIFSMPPPYHSTPDQSKSSLDTNMNSSITNRNHSNSSSPLIGYDSKSGLLGHDMHLDKCKRNEEFRLFDPNDACYLDDGMGFDLQSVLSMELLENASNNPRLMEAKNEEVLRRVAEMQKLVENSEQYLTENCDVYNDDMYNGGVLRDEFLGKESSVDQLESDTESNNSRMSATDDAPGILKHSDSLLLLTETINQGLSGLNVPENVKDNNVTGLTTRQSQGLSAILNNCGLTDALLALNNDVCHSESDNDSLYTPTSSPIRRHQNKPTNKVVRTSFGLHSPDAIPDNKEPNLKEYLKQLREKSSQEDARATEFPFYCQESMVDNDAELIDLTLIPPPQTPDELDCATQVPQILPVVPPSFADDKEHIQENNAPKASELEEFIANVTIQPPTVKVTPAIELTPEEILSYIIPPPPGSNSSTLDREQVRYVNHSQILETKNGQNVHNAKPTNGEVVKGTLSVSEIRNMFAAKSLSDARNSLLLKDKSKPQVPIKSDSPKGKRKSISGDKQSNGSAHVIEYPTVERKGMFSCCSKDKNKSDDNSDETEKVDSQMQNSDSMPDVCEIRPPPRRKGSDTRKPPERPPKTPPTPAPRPRSNSFTCLNNELTVVEIPNSHFSTLNNRKLNYKVVCEINEQNMQNPPQLPPRLENKVLSPPPPLLLPPKKPPLPPVPSIEVLRIKNAQKLSPIRHPEQRLASIGSPHFQRNLNTYKNLENESRASDDECLNVRSSQNYSSMTLQSRHVRSNSETKGTILKNKEISTALTLCSPQMNRRFSNRPDLLNGAPGNDSKMFSPPLSERKFRRDSASPTQKVQNHVRFKEDVVDDIPTPPSPPTVRFPEFQAGNNGHVSIENLLCKTEVAVDGLLQRLHQVAQKCSHQHAHGGGEDIDEIKFQRARSELTSCAVSLVGASRALVGALGAQPPTASGPPSVAAPAALADCLTPLRRLADLSQALGRHTSAPLQTRNLVLRVHDVTAAFKELAGAEMAQIIHEHNLKKAHNQDQDTNSTLDGQLALRAECLANVLATLLRSLRVFSP